MKPSRNLFVRLLSLSAMTLLASHSAQAAILTWTGGGNGTDWTTSNSDKNNWGGTKFNAGDDVIFGTAGFLAPTIGNTNLSAGTITFNSSAGLFVIGGSAILTINGGIVNNDNSLQSFSVTTITLGASQIWNAGTVSGGSLAFTGTTLNLGANQTLTIAGSNNTRISNLITGTGTSGILKTGTGVLTLSNAGSSYVGTTTIRAGTLAVGANAPSGLAGALGNTTSAVILGDASTLVGDAPSLLINGAFNVGRAISVGSGATTSFNATIGGSNTTGTSIFSGNITLNSPASNSYTTTLQAATGGTVDFVTGTWATNDRAIAIGSSGNTGIVRLSNTLSTTNTVSVNHGTLYVNGALNGGGSALTVASGATLGGTGSIAKATTIQSGGILNPGNSPGTLGFSAGLTVAAGGIFNWENNTTNTLGTAGTNWDRANVTGGSTTISSTPTTGSVLNLQFTNAGTDFANSFWNTNQTYGFITGGVTVGNLFDTSNIKIFLNGVQQGSNNTISGQGNFSTAVNGSNLELLWTATNNTKLWVGGAAPTTTLQTTSTTQAFGRVLVGTTQSANITLNSSGTDVSTTNATVVASGAGISTTTTSPGLISALTSSGINATLNTGAAGSYSGTINIDNQATTSAGASQGSDNGNAIINVSGTVVNQRSFTVGTTPIALGRFLIGATPAGTSAISSSGLNADTANASLGAFSTVSGLTLSTGDSTTFNGGAASQTANYTVGGTASGVGAISGTFSSAVTAELGSISNVTVGVTGTALNQRSFTVGTTPIDLGRFLIGATPAGTSAISSSGLNNFTANASLGGFSSVSGLTLTTGDSTAFNGAASQTANYSVGGTASGVGAISGSFSSVVTAELGSISNVNVAVTGTAVASRTVNAPTTTALGNFHAGAAVNVTSNSFGYSIGVGGTGANSDTENTTVQAYGGAADANGITLSGGANAINSASPFTRTFSGTATISSSSGSFSSTVNPEFSAATSVSAGYTIGVYSGQMVWSGAVDTSYATGGNWTDSVAGGANHAPGLDAGFTGVDTATFNGSGGSVALGGSSPNLNKVTFGNSGNYTVTTTTGSITMAGTTPTITTTGGIHEISASIAGSNGLIKDGGGTLALSAANTYTGATIIQAGTLKLLAGGSLASSSIVVGDVLDAITAGWVVASGQTVSGTGTINGNTTIQSGGFLAPGNSPGILTNLGDMTIDIGSTFQAEINGLTVGTGYDQLNVTGLSSTVTLAGLLSVTTGFSPTPGDLFFLIDNDGSSAISGVFSNAPIDGNTYTFGSQQYEISYFGDYGSTSFIGGNDLVLKAVPEPGAALLGGIGLLFLLRRRRA